MNASASWTTRRLGIALVLGAATVAGCGGSDDAAPDGSTDAGDASVAPTDTTGDVAAGDAASPSASGQAASEDPDDIVGDGSNDSAQQSMDDAGVDLDLDELEDTVNGFSTGDGGGAVTIDGSEYSFAASVCIAQGPSFLAEGPGTGPDGTPAWVEVSYSNDFDFDGDGEPDPTLDVFVVVGQTEMFGEGPDDQPDWTASKVDSSSMQIGGDISVQFDGNTVSGGGPIVDNNGVAVPFGESAPMTFEATCS